MNVYREVEKEKYRERECVQDQFQEPHVQIHFPFHSSFLLKSKDFSAVKCNIYIEKKWKVKGIRLFGLSII